MPKREIPSRTDSEQPHWVPLSIYWDTGIDPDHPLSASRASLEGTNLVTSGSAHKGIDVFLILSRGLEMQWGDVVRRPEPGDVLLVAMWEPHAWRCTEPVDHVIFCFLPEVLEAGPTPDLSLLSMFAVPASQRPRVTTPGMRRFVLTVAEEVARECEEPRPGRSVLLRSHLLRVLIALWRDWTPPGSTGPSSQIKVSDIERLQPAIALAHARPSEPVSPGEAADACGLSVSRFYEIFSQTMGLTYGDFHLRFRLALAARLLLESDLTVEAVAARTGFSDRSHLHHRFREHFGRAPSDYRNQTRVMADPLTSSAK